MLTQYISGYHAYARVHKANLDEFEHYSLLSLLFQNSDSPLFTNLIRNRLYWVTNNANSTNKLTTNGEFMFTKWLSYWLAFKFRTCAFPYFNFGPFPVRVPALYTIPFTKHRTYILCKLLRFYVWWLFVVIFLLIILMCLALFLSFITTA